MKYHFFVVCFPYYVFGGFSGQHIFHQFRQQTFIFCPHFQQTFFSDFGGDKLFISIFFGPPPPDIIWYVPKSIKNVKWDHMGL